MLLSELGQILSDNGFSYHPHPNDKYYTLVIENIRILEMVQQITSIDVCTEGEHFYICINLKDDYLYSEDGELNLYINLSVYVCVEMEDDVFMSGEFDENEFIEELHRLNIIGLNIKNAKKMIL